MRGPAYNRGKGEAIKFVRKALASRTDACILWSFAANPVNGYGQFGFEGKTYAPHRYVCEQTHGPRPTPKHQAAHSCHNRACINPRHLSWKTLSENMLDKRENGTASKAGGWRNGKLTASQVQQIRILKGLYTQDSLARVFKVTEATIRNIHKGKTYRRVADARI